MPPSHTQSTSRDTVFLRRRWLILSLVFGHLLLVLIPPFQSPDEPSHFMRVYQLSEGTWFHVPHDMNNLAGGYLPHSLVKICYQFDHLPFHPDRKTSVDEIWQAFHIPLNPQRRSLITFPNTACYNVVCYLPQTLAVGLGHLLSPPPLVLLYLAREASLLSYIGLGWLALRSSTRLARPLFVLLLMPESLWLASVISADTMTIAFATLFVAMVFGYRENLRQLLSTRDILALIFVTIPLAVCKMVYFPLLFLLILIPPARFASPRSRRKILSLILGTNALAFALLVLGTASPGTRINNNPLVIPRVQLAHLIAHPASIPGIVLATLHNRGWALARTFVGLIGWGDAYLPTPLILAYLLLFVAVCWIESQNSPQRDIALPGPSRANPWLPAVCVLLATFASTCGLLLLVHVFWDPVDLYFIDGLASRYFLPLTPAILALFATSARLPRPPFVGRLSDRKIDRALIMIVMIAATWFLILVWDRFYGVELSRSPLI